MSETRFTPGPWHVTECMDYWVEHVQARGPDDDNGGGPFNGVALCGDIHWPNFEARQREWEANARLIAAAPDLYAALERMTDNSCCIHSPKPPPKGCDCSFCQATRALSRAHPAPPAEDPRDETKLKEI